MIDEIYGPLAGGLHPTAGNGAASCCGARCPCRQQQNVRGMTSDEMQALGRAAFEWMQEEARRREDYLVREQARIYTMLEF